MQKKYLVVALLLSSALTRAEGSSLSLEAYLAQVKEGNRGFKAQQGTDAALRLAALEPQAMLSPYLNGQINYYDDQAEQAISFQPQRTTVSGWDLGVSKQMGFSGTRLSLGYKAQNQALTLAPFFPTPGGVEPTYFNTQGVSVSLVQPLLKDFGAAGYWTAQQKVDATLGAARAMNQFGAAATLFEAQSAYVQVALTRDIMRLLEDSLARNQKLLEWTKAKLADNLADKVDVLQVLAAVKQAELGINQTREELKKSIERFNTLRGRASDQVVEELASLTPAQALPTRVGERLDSVAAALEAKGRDASVQEVKQRYMPQLDLIGSVAGTGGDRPNPNETLPPDHPTYMVALKLTTILDLPLYTKVLAAAKKAAETSQDDLAQKRLKEAQEWQSLRTQWDSVQENLKLAQELEAVQSEKAEREKRRYLDGRTTNFQVLRFEEDFNQARVNTLRLKVLAAILVAQAEFYNGGGIQW